MPKSFLALFLLAAISAPALAADFEGGPGFDGKPLDPAQPVVVHIVSPSDDTLVPENNVDVFVQIDNYSVAEEGNAAHLILDNGAPQAMSDLRAPLTLRGLAEGGHTLRVLAVRPDGIALANPESASLVHFYVRRRDFQNAVDPAKPYLTVNLPVNSRGPGAALQGRVWFDFRTPNAPLAKEGGYVVRCTVNQAAQIVDTEKPIYWDKLQPGRYDLTAELLTSDLQPVPGPFNRVTRTFEIQAPAKAMATGTAAPPPPPPRAARKEAID